MFNSDSGSGSRRNWAAIIAIVLGLLAAIQVLRVNPPSGSPDSEELAKPVWTEGTIVDGRVEVSGESYLSFPLRFNHRVDLKGYFETARNDIRLVCTIIDETEFENWKAGGDVPIVMTTGKVPRGTIRKVMEPGSYILIFDNRSNTGVVRLPRASFTAE